MLCEGAKLFLPSVGVLTYTAIAKTWDRTEFYVPSEGPTNFFKIGIIVTICIVHVVHIE